MQRRTLIEHESLVPLMPYLQSTGLKGLSALLAGKNSYTASTLERYATKVAERVGELDNSIASLRLALGFIMDLATGNNASSAEYRYHYENFIFRAVGVIDRAHRLVGASLNLDAKKYESSRGNLYISGQVKGKYPAVYTALISIAAAVESHKALRNAVIHASAFSNREFGLLSAFENLNIPLPNDTDLQELKREHFLMNGGEVAIVISELEAKLFDLLNSLGHFYTRACSSDE